MGFAAGSYLSKLQRLQNKYLRATGNLPRGTSTRDLHMSFKIPYIYDFVTELCREQAGIINNENFIFALLAKERHVIGSTTGPSFVAVSGYNLEQCMNFNTI